MTNDLDFDHSEVEKATSSNTNRKKFLQSIYGWRGPVPNMTLLRSKMTEKSWVRDEAPVIPFLNIMTFEQPLTGSEA